jgi:hypothetical protein
MKYLPKILGAIAALAIIIWFIWFKPPSYDGMLTPPQMQKSDWGIVGDSPIRSRR